MTSAKRSAAAPDVPTLQEQGLKDFETGSWFGLSVVAGTPRDIVAKPCFICELVTGNPSFAHHAETIVLPKLDEHSFYADW